MRFRAILNRDGGTLRTMDLDAFCQRATEVFAAQGHELDCQQVAGKQVEAALKKAADDPAVDAIIAGGGDGTISTAAATAFASGKPLGILPAGTMNLFARALKMPPDLEGSLLALASGTVDNIDIATANGRPFVHQFGVGIHARLVRIRNDMVYRSRIGKMVASLRAIFAAAINPPRFEVDLDQNGVTRRVVASGIAVSNNPLAHGPFPVAGSLDAGVLGVYVASSVTTGELIGLMADVFTGKWRQNDLVSEAEVQDMVLRFPRRRGGLHAVIDGELISLDKDVRLQLHPKALAIVRPAQE